MELGNEVAAEGGRLGTGTKGLSPLAGWAEVGGISGGVAALNHRLRFWQAFGLTEDGTARTEALPSIKRPSLGE